MFSKVIECLEQNIRKQIDCKILHSTKHINIVQNICFKGALSGLRQFFATENP